MVNDCREATSATGSFLLVDTGVPHPVCLRCIMNTGMGEMRKVPARDTMRWACSDDRAANGVTSGLGRVTSQPTSSSRLMGLRMIYKSRSSSLGSVAVVIDVVIKHDLASRQAYRQRIRD